MQKKFNKNTYNELKANNNAFIVHKSIPLGRINPLDIIKQLNLINSDVSLLQSSLVGFEGRFSFLHYNSIYEYSATVEEIASSNLSSPLAVLRDYQAEQKISFSHILSKYTGGLIGYLSYDSVRLFEEIPDRHEDKETPDVFFRAYKNSIGIDHKKNELVVSVLVDITPSFEETLAVHNKALAEIENIIAKLQAPFLESQESNLKTEVNIKLNVNLDIEDAQFESLVEVAKNYIIEGDVFQVVLSRQFEVPITISAYDLYDALNIVSPSPFMFYMELPYGCIVGASPEKLISLEAGVLQSSPLAGTRPRGEGISDIEMESDLSSDPKEKAEHMMLVDLARNDVGKIAKPGSVKPKELMKAHYFSHVMHLSSSIEGQIMNGLTAFDALEAALPAGTLSGAPKVRAMEVIDELEQSRRGIYGGSICAIDTKGNLNSCIVIRTALVTEGLATIRAGAGIVYDSQPSAEAQETKDKARSLLEAIKYAESQKNTTSLSSVRKAV